MKNLLQLAVLSLVPVLLFSCDRCASLVRVHNDIYICSSGNEVTIGFYNGTSTDYYWDSVTIGGDYRDSAYFLGSSFILSVPDPVKAKLERELSTITIQRKSGNSPVYIVPQYFVLVNGEYCWIPSVGLGEGCSDRFPPYPAIQIVDSMRSQCPEFVLTVSDDQLHTFNSPPYPLPYAPSITISE